VLDAGEAADLRQACARERVYAAAGAGDEDAGELVFQFGAAGAVAMVCDAMARGDAADRARAAWCGPDGRASADALRARVEALGGTWRSHDEQGAALAACVLGLAAEAQLRVRRGARPRGRARLRPLIHRTRDLPAPEPRGARRPAAALTWLFIDEFQDTTRRTARIAYALCGVEEALAAAPSRPSRTAGAPSICVVGDPEAEYLRLPARADVTL
jgi:hypothetical protein